MFSTCHNLCGNAGNDGKHLAQIIVGLDFYKACIYFLVQEFLTIHLQKKTPLSALGLQILFLGLLELPTSFVSTVELSLSQDVCHLSTVALVV